MRKILFLLIAMPFFSNAQEKEQPKKTKNIIKWNLSSMAVKNYHFTYERSIGKKITFSLSYRNMPKGSLPLQTQFKNAINSQDINFDNFKLGNTAITPEIRFYLSRGNMKGFYIAPYARFANFDVSMPINYTSGSTTKEAIFDGKISSSSAGVLLGYQFKLGSKMVLDFQIIGGHYGSSKGDLNFRSATALSTVEQITLQQNINEIQADPFKFTSTVNANGAQVITDGPWAGIRGLNFGLGFRF